MKSSILLLSALAASCFSAAVPVAERDVVLARGAETVTVVVTVTSVYTKKSTTTSKKPTTRRTTTAKQTGTIVYVTVTNTVTKKTTGRVTTAPKTTSKPWWGTTTAKPVTVYSTVTAGEDDNPNQTDDDPTQTDDDPTQTGDDPTETDDPNDNAAAYSLLPITRTVEERAEPWGPPWRSRSWGQWRSSWLQSPDPATSEVSEVTTTVYVVGDSPSPTDSDEPARITFYPPNNAAREAKPQNWWSTVEPDTEEPEPTEAPEIEPQEQEPTERVTVTVEVDAVETDPVDEESVNKRSPQVWWSTVEPDSEGPEPTEAPEVENEEPGAARTVTVTVDAEPVETDTVELEVDKRAPQNWWITVVSNTEAPEPTEAPEIELQEPETTETPDVETENPDTVEVDSVGKRAPQNWWITVVSNTEAPEPTEAPEIELQEPETTETPEETEEPDTVDKRAPQNWWTTVEPDTEAPEPTEAPETEITETPQETEDPDTVEIDSMDKRAPQIFNLGPPSRTVLVQPSSSVMRWWPWSTTIPEPTETPEPLETPEYEAPDPIETDPVEIENRKRSPQIFSLGSPSRTVLVQPTSSQPWWVWYPTTTAEPVYEPEPTETPEVETEEPETIYIDPIYKRAPQIYSLGRPSRTVLVKPTATQTRWNWQPTETAESVDEPETIDEPEPTQSPEVETEEPDTADEDPIDKREPQIYSLGRPSRTVTKPTSSQTRWNWQPTETAESVDEPETVDEPEATESPEVETEDPEPVNEDPIDKREPQTLYPPTRTTDYGPEPTTYYDDPDETTSWYAGETTTTVWLPTSWELTPQTTVYVTVTAWPAVTTTQAPHHNPHKPTTTAWYSSEYNYPNRVSVISASLTVPNIVVMPTNIYKEKRDPQSLNVDWPMYTPNPPPTSTLETVTVYRTSYPKENPCQNNMFAPPAWCTTTITLTVTPTVYSYGGTVIEATATLPPYIVTSGYPGYPVRKERRAKRFENAQVRRQELVDPQTRSFTFLPEYTDAPEKN